MTNQSNNSLSGLPAAVGLADLLKLVRRRLLLILAVTLSLTLLAALVLSTVAPRYSAETLLILDQRGAEIANVESVITGLSGEPETVMSEIQVLKSRRLANQVIEQLGIDQRAEFNSDLQPPGWFSGPADAQNRDENTNDFAGDDGELMQGKQVRIVNAFLERLNVEPIPGSRAIKVTFSSEDRVLAARSANALADLYLTDQLESKYESVQRAADWLNARVASLRDKVRESEDRVEAFRQESGLLEGGGTTLTDQEISQINTQVIEAGNERAVAEANLRQIQRLLKTPSGVESAGEVLKSSLIQRLREQEASIARRIAELSSEYGDRHPTMIKMRAEQADMGAKIEAEITKIVSGLENRVRIARSNEGNLNRNLDDAKKRVGEDNKALVTLRSYEREAAANRLVLESMLTRFAQTSEQDNPASQRPDARVISRAVVPEKPSYPMTSAILALTFLAAAFAGLMLALALEFMDEGVRSGEQLEQITSLPSLGFVPRLKRRELKGLGPLTYFVDNPSTPFAESIRTLYSNIRGMGEEGEPVSLLLTSALANEGKTSVALCLASLMSLSDKRVVVIDGDCRRPDLAKQLGIDAQAGLMEHLDAGMALTQIVHTHESTGIDLIAAGLATRNPPATLGSERFAQMLETLQSRYDYIVIDSPPTLAVSDALTIAPQVDATVLVARWGSTRSSAVRLAAKQLSSSGAQVAGCLLTMVDAQRYAQYGYGDAGSYTGELASYQRV